VGRIERIFIKRAKRGPMDPAPRATLVAGRGILGNANQGGTRQVTIIAAERWDELMRALRADLDPGARRANIVVSGMDLEESRGRTLKTGPCRLLIRGETRPCEQMEAAWPGLQRAMRERWGGGAFAEVLAGGDITVGAGIDWE
jgi:MOSC domain-containing protein YiiM